MPPPALTRLSVDELVGMAGVNPWELHDRLMVGRPEQIDELANSFHRAASRVAEGDGVFGEARSCFQGAYSAQSGGDTINESPEVTKTANDFQLGASQLDTISRSLDEVAHALTTAQNTTGEYVGSLNATLSQLDAMAEAIGPGSGANEQQYDQIRAEGAGVVGSAGDLVTGVVSSYQSTLHDHMALAQANRWHSGSARRGGDPAATIPGNGTDPATVKQWWNGLSDTDKQRLIDEHPDRIGNLNGVPIADRSAANELSIDRDIHRVDDVAAAHHVPSDEVLAHPELYGLDASAVTRYRNANHVLDARKTDANGGRNRTYVMAYDPLAFGGKGRAAVTIGDPDQSDNIAVVVPGTGNHVNKGWSGAKDSISLYEQANKADPDHKTAVVSWMGYDAPDSPTDPRMLTPATARASGAALADDVNSLWATHDGSPQHVTVIGHSYGSTTVADAAAANQMHATDVALIGCPGTDLAHNAGDFHLDGGHVYVGDASTDPVGMLSSSPLGMPGISVAGVDGPGLGDADPAGVNYGAQRFKAEASDASPGSFVTFADHSQYYKPGSESLYNLSTIAAGHGDSLGDQGMLAAHRPSVAPVSVPNPLGGILGPDRINLPNPLDTGIGKLADPELLRGGVTDNHNH